MEFNAAVLKTLPWKVTLNRENSVNIQWGSPTIGVRHTRTFGKLVEELCNWLNQPWLGGLPSLTRRDLRRLDAVFKAIMAHLYIAWIQSVR